MKKYFREPFPAISHLIGAILSVIALISLLQKSGSHRIALLASAIYGGSLILLYLASTLTHGMHSSEKLLSHFERCDHAAIFFLIAGTYTPLCLLIIPGAFGWTLLALEWILAFAGIYTIFIQPDVPKLIRVGIYLCMGWLFIFALGPIIAAVPNTLLSWLFAGVFLYSIGAIFFVTERPNFFPGKFEAHDLWHIFVMGGSTCHFIFISNFLTNLKFLS